MNYYMIPISKLRTTVIFSKT